MFSCSLCGYEFTYKQALSIGSRLGVGKDCPNCGKTNYYSAKSRRKGMLLVILAAIAGAGLNMLPISFPFVLSLLFLFLVIIYLLYPFLIELTDHEEPLW